MFRRMSIALSVAVLLGCGDKEKNEKRITFGEKIPLVSARPKSDLSSPEGALKSYWAQKEWYADVSIAATIELEKLWELKVKEVFGAVATGEVLSHWSDARQEVHAKVALQRIVQSIELESGSRAVALVLIKNVTPIPEGAQSMPREVKRREDGVLFRYIVEKNGYTWKVAELWRNNPLTGWEELSRRPPPWFPSDVYGD